MKKETIVLLGGLLLAGGAANKHSEADTCRALAGARDLTRQDIRGVMDRVIHDFVPKYSFPGHTMDEVINNCRLVHDIRVTRENAARAISKTFYDSGGDIPLQLMNDANDELNKGTNTKKL